MKLTMEQAKDIMEKNGGSLDLGGTQITSLPDNLTVGGWLYLGGTQITSLPDNLTVGGSLDLMGTNITSLPDNLTVGGSLDLSETQIKDKEKEKKRVKRLHDGDYVPGKYLYADGILTHVKSSNKINGYIFYRGKIRGKNVVSDGKYFAHCDKMRDGVADILFKKAEDRGADQYKGLPLDTVVSLEDAKTMYRIITGACRQGTEAFVESLKQQGKLQSEYTIKEMLEVTKGQYNYERFSEFFGES